MLQKIKIADFTTIGNTRFDSINITYEVFGRALFEAPIVLVNHALTGNSTVCGKNGWWKGLIGKGKCINTDKYTVLSFNIPGNAYGGKDDNLIGDHKIFIARDIAMIFIKALEGMKIQRLHAVIGGSVGGGIAWEMAVLKPELIDHLIPVAADWKSNDWLKANCLLQEQILLNSTDPVHDARLHAMLTYRSAQSFREKFGRSYNHQKKMYNVERWMLHHGKKLKDRFSLSAYKMLNHILAHIDIIQARGSFEEVVARVNSNIHLISINSDIFFTADENHITYKKLKRVNKNVTHGIIDSVHGHDAFLIEFDQLSKLLKMVF